MAGADSDRETPHEVTKVLAAVGEGADGAREELLGLVYQELRSLAADKMRGERAAHTLQPTALVHEAFLRLFRSHEPDWENRAHFYGAAAEVMRRILVDHARTRATRRRGGDRRRVPLAAAEGEPVHGERGVTKAHAALDAGRPEEILAVDAALSRLEEADPEKARLVQLRFFAGLTLEEIATLSGASVPTLKRRWRYARAWLYREMSKN